MANKIQIKHGTTAPGSGKLSSFELGYATQTGKLYISTNGSNIVDITPYLSLSGGTVTGGITKTTTPSSWVAGMTATNVLYFGALSQSSYHPMIRVNSYSGHVWNLGGLGNSVGIYGYYSGRTANGTDWSTYWNTATGNLHHTNNLSTGGTISEAGTALSSKYAALSHTHAYVPTTRTVNSKALSANISLAAADVGAVPTTRTVNSKALSANISLTAADVGAAASSHSHTWSNITRAGNLEVNSTDTTGNYGNSAIEIREVNLVTTAQTAPAYAPQLSFHWGGRVQKSIALRSDGQLVTRTAANDGYVLLDGGNYTSYTSPPNLYGTSVPTSLLPGQIYVRY